MKTRTTIYAAASMLAVAAMLMLAGCPSQQTASLQQQLNTAQSALTTAHAVTLADEAAVAALPIDANSKAKAQADLQTAQAVETSLQVLVSTLQAQLSPPATQPSK